MPYGAREDGQKAKADPSLGRPRTKTYARKNGLLRFGMTSFLWGPEMARLKPCPDEGKKQVPRHGGQARLRSMTMQNLALWHHFISHSNQNELDNLCGLSHFRVVRYVLNLEQISGQGYM